MEFNLSQVVRAVATAVPDRAAIIRSGTDQRTFAELVERSDRLAAVLGGAGLGAHRDRADLAPWDSGQDHLALYLQNGPEYLEGMLGAYAARVAPFNVNYRYVAEELRYLLDDSGAAAIVYHSTFAPVLAEVRADLPHLQLLLQVDDGSGNALLDGARWYEDALAAAPPTPPAAAPSPDDLYILYTGGTTGMPKGVLWRQGDIYPAALGGRQLATGEEWADLDAIVASAREGDTRILPAAPFMHGAAHWIAMNALGAGSTVVLPEAAATFDPAAVWAAIERDGVSILLIVGDAFGRPLLDELDRHEYDLSSLVLLISGGAALSVPVKTGLLDRLPGMAIMDAVGASETGTQGSQVTGAGSPVTTGTFTPGAGTAIVSEDLSRLLEPGSDELGWLAQHGRVPLGYLGDEEKTAPHVPDHRRGPLLGAGRPGPHHRRRGARAPRPGLRDDQLGGREDLRRGGRGRPGAAPRRVRRGRRRPSVVAVGPGGGGGRPAPPRRPRHNRRPRRRVRAPRGAVQAAQGGRPGGPGRPLTGGQGRLPVGAPCRRSRRGGRRRRTPAGGVRLTTPDAPDSPGGRPDRGSAGVYSPAPVKHAKEPEERRRRWWLPVVAVVAVLAVIGLGVAVVSARDGSDSDQAAPSAPDGSAASTAGVTAPDDPYAAYRQPGWIAAENAKPGTT